VNWQAITSLITALTAVGALAFTGLSLNSTRDQVVIAQQGQLTDRYTKAVEQLDRAGPDHLQARLGAVYGLERLALDSPRDQPTIIAVLSAFVRTTTPPTPQCPDKYPDADVQAALTVLVRRNSAHDNNAVIDLSKTCLLGADLRNANLAGANLRLAQLRGSVLIGANLDRANLHSADISHSSLSDASLRKVDASKANLEWTALDNTVLVEAELGGANLRFGELTKADFSRASLVGADLTRSELSGADLTDVRHDETTVIADIMSPPKRGQWW
jgi:uncharacterized protein YjbI with pentapeptide repeats